MLVSFFLCNSFAASSDIVQSCLFFGVSAYIITPAWFCVYTSWLVLYLKNIYPTSDGGNKYADLNNLFTNIFFIFGFLNCVVNGLTISGSASQQTSLLAKAFMFFSGFSSSVLLTLKGVIAFGEDLDNFLLLGKVRPVLRFCDLIAVVSAISAATASSLFAIYKSPLIPIFISAYPNTGAILIVVKFITAVSCFFSVFTLYYNSSKRNLDMKNSAKLNYNIILIACVLLPAFFMMEFAPISIIVFLYSFLDKSGNIDTDKLLLSFAVFAGLAFSLASVHQMIILLHVNRVTSTIFFILNCYSYTLNFYVGLLQMKNDIFMINKDDKSSLRLDSHLAASVTDNFLGYNGNVNDDEEHLVVNNIMQ